VWGSGFKRIFDGVLAAGRLNSPLFSENLDYSVFGKPTIPFLEK
jgi:predicted HTH transcriptional regulator